MTRTRSRERTTKPAVTALGKSGLSEEQQKDIVTAIQKLRDSRPAERNQNASALARVLERHLTAAPSFVLGLNLSFYPGAIGVFDSKVKLPVTGSILLTEGIRRVIDSPEFQRLRGVRQLGPTMFVFPGANHTRFEHLLGCYSLALRYIERLSKIPHFEDYFEPVAESTRLVVLSALLHDIGHYPYSHWIEEIDKGSIPKGYDFPRHEERARSILCGEDSRIGRLLADQWSIDPSDIADVIERKSAPDSLINSFTNSIVDVDKLDYLVRDSVHCGVHYGEGIDTERFLDSLWIDPSTNKICVTEKGKSALQSIISCRNNMYQEVYWHKTVRAGQAMFKRFFYEYLMAGIDDLKALERYFGYADDYFVNVLWNRSTTTRKDLGGLISPFAFRGRVLYKPAYVFYFGQQAGEPPEVRTFFRERVARANYSELVKLGESLANELVKKIPGVTPLDVIIDRTPIREEHERSHLEGFRTWNTKKSRWEECPPSLRTLNNYLGENQQAYVFCNPKYYGQFRELAGSGGELARVFGRASR